MAYVIRCLCRWRASSSSRAGLKATSIPGIVFCSPLASAPRLHALGVANLVKSAMLGAFLLAPPALTLSPSIAGGVGSTISLSVSYNSSMGDLFCLFWRALARFSLLQYHIMNTPLNLNNKASLVILYHRACVYSLSLICYNKAKSHTKVSECIILHAEA